MDWDFMKFMKKMDIYIIIWKEEKNNEKNNR